MESPCKIIFFGDSISKELLPGFAEKIKKEYPSKQIDIVDYCRGGDTTVEAIERLESVSRENAQVIVVGFGMNDWRKNISTKDFRQNYQTIISKLSTTTTRVIPMTMNPAFRYRLKGLLKIQVPEVGKYNCIIKELALKNRLKIAAVHDTWIGKSRFPWQGLKDNIHPNEAGNSFYHEALMHVIPRSHTVVLWQYNGRECLCNYRCPYCYYNWSPRSQNYYWGEIEEWRDAFKDCFGKQNLIFYLAFGEPTLGEAFYNIVKMIGNQENWKLRITTNLSQDLTRLMETRVVKEGRLYINASFHPTQTTKEEFLEKLLFLRKHGIEAPIVYVMWPPQMKRFESDFEFFDRHDFLVHIRRFTGKFKGKHYPESYTEEERRLVARYADDATIKYMLNNKPLFDRRTYSGQHFFVVDCTGNVGLDSDCFHMRTKYRTLIGNVIQSLYFKPKLKPSLYPPHCQEGTVDGVSNYLESGLHQLENNNVLHFARQGGVYHSEDGVVYENQNLDFDNPLIRAEYFFPSRNFKDELAKIRTLPLRHYLQYTKMRIIWLFKAHLNQHPEIKKRLRPLKKVLPRRIGQ